MILFDFQCRDCGAEFEELVARDDPNPAKCPQCSSTSTTRLISGTHMDPRMGIDAASFPTLGDKWARVRRERKAIELKRKLAHGDSD